MGSDRRTGQLWLIVSIGHCGTRWLATVLEHQTGIRCYHELKPRMAGMRWWDALRYERRLGAGSPKYRRYWRQLHRDQRDNEIVCDANSWSPTRIPAGDYRPDRIIYLVRHGVSQLHSLATKSSVWRRAPLDHYALDDYLREYLTPAGRPGMKPWDRWTRWERLCLLWERAALMPDRLRDQGYEVDVFRFEDLTQGEALLSLCPDMSREELEHWRRTDINRKVKGSRRPEDIWQQWTPTQQAIFGSCNAGMARYGYEMPAHSFRVAAPAHRTRHALDH